MRQIRSEEYKAQHRIREQQRYWEKHKDDKGICKVCNKEYLKIERKGTTKTCSTDCQKINRKNLDKKRCPKKKSEYQKQYLDKNRDKLLEYQRQYRKSTKGKEVSRNTECRPERKLAKTMRTHVKRQMGIKGKVSREDLIKILDMKTECIICFTKDDLTIDHKMPLSRGGTNDLDNLQVLCRTCNSTKHAKTMDEFLEYLSNKK